MHTIQSKSRQSDVLNISHSTFLKLDLIDHLQAVNAGAGKKLMLVFNKFNCMTRPRLVQIVVVTQI